jgi:inhibitor of cysteine peptidase
MERGTRRGLAVGAAALALAALGATLLVACGGSGGGGDADSGSTIRLAPQAGGSTTVAVDVGDTVILTLEANATTGYEWTFTAGDTFTIVKSEYVPDANPDQLAGKGGSQVVTLKVTKVGSSDLTGTYARSWETPSPGAQPDVTVKVKSIE